jgi:hypothetical protein
MRHIAWQDGKPVLGNKITLGLPLPFVQGHKRHAMLFQGCSDKCGKGSRRKTFRTGLSASVKLRLLSVPDLVKTQGSRTYVPSEHKNEHGETRKDTITRLTQKREK